MFALRQQPMILYEKTLLKGQGFFRSVGKSSYVSQTMQIYENN